MDPNLFPKKTDKELFPVKLEKCKRLLQILKHDVSYSGYFDFVFDIRIKDVV